MTTADQPTTEADERPVLVERTLAQILAFYRPGSHDWTWAEEYADVMQHERTEAIWKRVSDEGVGFLDHVSPVLLGSDDRVWDGHHRICIAIAMDLPTLMVEVTDRLPNVLAPAPQPTTEASERGPLSGLDLTVTRMMIESRGWIGGDLASALVEEVERLTAPQPAADTETEYCHKHQSPVRLCCGTDTEVQWGVRSGHDREPLTASSEDSARGFVRQRPGWVVVKQHRTPWEEA